MTEKCSVEVGSAGRGGPAAATRPSAVPACRRGSMDSTPAVTSSMSGPSFGVGRSGDRQGAGTSGPLATPLRRPRVRSSPRSRPRTREQLRLAREHLEGCQHAPDCHAPSVAPSAHNVSHCLLACLAIRFCVGCASIIPMIIQTILLDPSAAVWTDGSSNVSRPDPSGAVQVDAEHPARNRKVGGNLSRFAASSWLRSSSGGRVVRGCCPFAAQQGDLERRRPGGGDPPGR
jgi:hypothetical protein